MNPYFGLALGVLAASFSSLFIKLADAPSLVIAFYRILFTFLILAPYTIYKFRAEFKALRPKEVLQAIMSGAFLALHFVTWFSSLNYTTVASSTVLVTTQPIFVVLGSYVFFREKIPLKAMFGGLIALLGSIFIGLSDFSISGTALWGDTLALIGAVAVSGYFLFGRHLRKKVSLMPYVLMVYASGSLVLLVCMLFTRTSFFGYGMQDYSLFLALAIVCTIFGHTVFTWALKYIKAPIVSIAILGEPIAASLWVATILVPHEYPSLTQVIGGSIILIGLALFTRVLMKENS